MPRSARGGAAASCSGTRALPGTNFSARFTGEDVPADEPFAVTARARGLTERSVLVRHALRHSLLPAVTLLGWLSGTLIGGSVIIEQVFGRPGLGQVTLQAVSSSDMPVVLAVVVLAAGFFVVVNTVADLAYLIIDPRLRRS